MSSTLYHVGKNCDCQKVAYTINSDFQAFAPLRWLENIA